MIANNEKTTQPPSAETACIGTKIGKCDICKVTKKILLLKYGFSLCEDCLSICTLILEQIQLNEEKSKRPKKTKPVNTQSICPT